MVESIIFGTLQGILEWLPISSQGNLVLAMVGIFGYSTKKALELSVFLHWGTLLAAIIYFRKDIKEIFAGLKNYELPRPLGRGIPSGKFFLRFSSPPQETGYSHRKNKLAFKFGETQESKIISFLLVSTLLTGFLGYPLFKLLLITSSFPGEIFIGLVGAGLILSGILQKIAVKRNQSLKTKENLCLKDSILLGIAQGLSIIPGISRSGITSSTFLFLGYKPETALNLSFLMSIPAVLAAEVGLKLIEGLTTINLRDALVGIFFSFLFGILTIHLFLKISKKINFWLFCIVLGIIALIPLVFYL